MDRRAVLSVSVVRVHHCYGFLTKEPLDPSVVFDNNEDDALCSLISLMSSVSLKNVVFLQKFI